MKKIGILTFHRTYNYGAYLQAFALSKYLNAKIIDYYCKNVYKYHKIIKPLRRNILKYCTDLLSTFFHLKKVLKRKKNFEKAINYLNILPFSGSNINNLEYLITGSDQVWNHDIVGEISDVYTLNIGKKDIIRISYAASIGNANDIQKYKLEYLTKLDTIDYISVREKSLVKPLEKLLNKKVVNVVDPTLLLNSKEWNNYLDKKELIPDNYIFAYVVEPDKEFIKAVNFLIENTGCKVVHAGLKNPGFKGEVISIYTAGPFSFVNYIKNAKYVVTTSFHATVFSIIFHKDFYTIPHKKTGSRVTGILEQLKLESRIFNNTFELSKIFNTEDIEWIKVDKRLNKLIDDSKKWINKAISKNN